MRIRIAALALVLAGCGGTTQAERPAEDAAPRAEPPAAAAAPPAQPSTEVGGDRIVLPVTFADGVTVDLVYPAGLALERQGPPSEVILAADTGGSEVRRQVHLVRAGELTEPDGQEGRDYLELEGLSEGTDYLLLARGEWEALVVAGLGHGAPPLSEAERRAWSEDLGVVKAATGFPIVVPGPRLRIAPKEDEQVVPVMLVLEARGLDPGLALTRPDSCAVASLEVNWRCDEDTSVVVSPYGDTEFQQAVLTQVDVRNVRPAA